MVKAAPRWACPSGSHDSSLRRTGIKHSLDRGKPGRGDNGYFRWLKCNDNGYCRNRHSIRKINRSKESRVLY